MKPRTITVLLLLLVFAVPTVAQEGAPDLAYPDVLYMPLDAFRENRNTNREDHTEIGTAIFQECLKKKREAAVRDWNTMRSNPDLNLNGIRYFITYSHSFNPETGVCSVTITVYSGPKYDPNSSKELGSFYGTSQLGYTDFNGNEVKTEDDCLYHAGAYAARELCKSNLFARGWELRQFPE